ncbi:MAG TPA: long-chain fatty acid--CoA ligase [Gemmatimonadales bacterium]|nr:long-chain fatty acid--CoA ligase [Gemmatimonadales bacterium]
MEQRVWHKHYDAIVPPSLTYERLVLPERLERSAEAYPDQPAILFLGSRLTYRQLKDQVDRFATALSALGVRKGTRVAIHLPNIPQTVIAYYAVLSLGGQVVMTNPLYVERELEHQWNDAGCEVAITADFLFAARLRHIRSRLPIKHYVVASIPEYLPFPLRQIAPLKLRRMKPAAIARVAPAPGVHFFRKLVSATEPDPPAVSIDLDDVATLQYTGGTTGVSKGAMLTHRNLSVNVQQCITWLHCTHGTEVVLSALPLFHVFGMTVCMNFPIGAAATIVLLPNPRDIPALIKAVVKDRVTLFMGVPAMFNAINESPGIEHRDIRCVKSCFSGSAPLPTPVVERFEALTGSHIVEGFGLTETSPVTHVNPWEGLRKPGSIGIPFPDTDSKVVDLETGTRALPPGEAGELLIRGPQVMAGYWNMPGETAEVLKDGWLHTGDIATIDEDGYHRIVGRKKDMILASGYNVYPDEVDGVLMKHPAVLEAATIGVSDPKRGESIKSFIVLKPGEHATAEQIIAYCRSNLAAYKVPRLVEFRDSLPKSGILKILRMTLREEERAKAGAGVTA